MELIYKEALNKRDRNSELKQRLSLYAELIYCALQNANENKENAEEAVNILIRKSSELKPYAKTTDLISNNTFGNDKNCHEHIVPCCVIKKHLFDKSANITVEYIKTVLLKYGLRAIITKEENKAVDIPYKKTMPNEWSIDKKDNPLIRYEGIIKNIQIRNYH